jgi:hypothetical protein
MRAPPRWQRCIAHHDREVVDFVERYFGADDRVCLLIAGAGFDPRSASVARLLAGALAPAGSERLRALFIRERRPNPDLDLVERGDRHASELTELVLPSKVVDVEVLSREDGAVVGGYRAIKVLRDERGAQFAGVTDVVLDMSALSIGISFPVARYLFETCREMGPAVNFHVIVASHPLLDAAISSVPSDVVDPIRGFSGGIDLADSEQDPKIWLPHLAPGRNSALQLIRDKLQGPVAVCPVLPLSQRDPRVADRLIAAFENELYQEWEVDPRNLIYAIEDDPLDLYRTITAIYRRHTGVFSGVTRSHLVLSPSGNKVLAIGALMAALEHDLPVRYVEAVSHIVDWTRIAQADPNASRLVHVWLHGAPYALPSRSVVSAKAVHRVEEVLPS